MSYTALYRKFRPQEFEDVKGQDHIVTTLKNQIKADRIGQAYYFAEQEEPVKRRSQKFLQKQSTVSIRWMAALVGNVRPVKQSRRAVP